MAIQLNKHDENLACRVKNEIKSAVARADMPAAVAKRIASIAMGYRNKGRKSGIKRYPFQGICEASGYSLKREDANLDEIEPEKGYSGKVRWVCAKANNSGKRSCGGC